MMFNVHWQGSDGAGNMEIEDDEHEMIKCHVAEQGFPDKSPRKIYNGPSTQSPDISGMNVRETMEWIASECVNFEEMETWIEKGQVQNTPSNHDQFCDPELLMQIIKTKQDVFDKFTANELLKARIRANPFETIKSAFFMNRAALKMANIDATTDFMFTEIDRDVRHKTTEGPYYFADVCAGPGGFSEYVLWRKRWAFKGFGFTLRGEHDFKLLDSTCCCGATFQGYHGSSDDGNVCDPDNIKDFASKVLHETDGSGVHFMMADGGFSVEGNEHLQETLSKQLYVCQCLVALDIVRKHGHFVTKLFDTFTLFSVGLLFLMYHCFENVTIIKPNTSRPANSERYFICKGLKDDGIVEKVRAHLRRVVHELWDLKSSTDVDITSVVPLKVIESDERFKNFITECNNRLGKSQMLNLQKLEIFSLDPSLLDTRQEELRKKCLLTWRIPDRVRSGPQKYTIEDLISTALSKPEYLYVRPRDIIKGDDLDKIISDVGDWHYSPLFDSCGGSCNIYAAVGTLRVYRLQDYKWIKVKHIRLARGSLLYGEMINERAIDKTTMKETEVKSLHVIDALRLGDTSLADLPFDERSSLIRTYCKAVHFETTQKSVRLRAKCVDKLGNLPGKSLVQYDPSENKYFCRLSPIGYYSTEERFDVHSILFLKTNETQLFNTTYVLRAQLYLDKMICEEEEEDTVHFETLSKFLKNKVHGVLLK